MKPGTITYEVDDDRDYVRDVSEEVPGEGDILEDLGVLLPSKSSFKDEPKTGSGLNICPDIVINDVLRLEVLIIGKRAGNTSPEIINEATGIGQRLFQNKVIDAHIYRELVDELIDNDWANEITIK